MILYNEKQDKIFVAMMFILMVLFLSPLIYTIYTPKYKPLLSSDSTSIQSLQMFSTMNKWREASMLEPYAVSQDLCSFAKRRLEEVKKDFSHNGFRNNAPEGFKKLGENLSKGYPSVEEAFKALLASPSHRETLNNNYKFACAECDEKYCVQEFGDK